MRNWHQDDELWEIIAPFIFEDQRWKDAPVEIDRIVPLLSLNPGASVLDLCCGPGRHALELARRGCRVTGVDRTAAYLNKAKEKADEEGLTIEFVQDDMRNFCRPNTFDGAIMMLTSFGYFEAPAENLRVLANVYRSLRDTGSLLLDLIGKEVLARIHCERDWREQDGALFLEERIITNDWSRMENRWILQHGHERHEFKVTFCIYSASELSTLLKESGFGSVEIYGDLEGSPYDQTAKRLVAVARKESSGAA
jgi:SAM-dependent methyltransferase